MITFTDIQQKLQPQKQRLLQQYHIKYLAVFGSVSRGENTNTSDIDMLVDFTQPIGIEFIDLAYELEDILQHKVELVSRNTIKPKYYIHIKNDIKYV